MTAVAFIEHPGFRLDRLRTCTIRWGQDLSARYQKHMSFILIILKILRICSSHSSAYPSNLKDNTEEVMKNLEDFQYDYCGEVKEFRQSKHLQKLRIYTKWRIIKNTTQYSSSIISWTRRSDKKARCLKNSWSLCSWLNPRKWEKLN